MHHYSKSTTVALAFASHILRLRAAKSLAALLVLFGPGPSMVAQQYCVSGAITSIPICSGCSFKVGDPVAMTFTIQAGSINCVSSAISSGCSANADFSAQIGGLYWSGQQLQPSSSGTVSFQRYIGPRRQRIHPCDSYGIRYPFACPQFTSREPGFDGYRFDALFSA